MIKFSVIIPVYNNDKTLKETLNSALSQISPTDEVIMVDDASTDHSLSFMQHLSDPRIKTIQRKQNGGISAARNTGLKEATGDYIAFLDADDLWPENRHAKILEAINKEQPDIISGLLEHFYCPSLSANEAKRFRLPEIQPGSIASSMVFSRRAVQHAKEFNPSLQAGELLDFVSKMLQFNMKWSKLNTVLLKRRIHGENYTIQRPSTQADYLKAIRQHMERQK